MEIKCVYQFPPVLMPILQEIVLNQQREHFPYIHDQGAVLKLKSIL